MFLKSLYLRNFRNYIEAEAHFHPHLNHFAGHNGQGKTNLLEAIALLSTGRSFRTPHLSELIRLGADSFFLEAQLIRDNVPQQLRITFDGRARQLTLNATSHPSFTPLLGLLPSVTLVPSDAELIDGAPLARRRFLNLHLSQSDPLYVHHLIRYTRALKQRNCLLRKQSDALSPWDALLIPSGLYLIEQRAALLSRLNLTYQPAAPLDSDAYQRELTRTRPRDLLLGSTHIGPHRDDFEISFEGKSARHFGSEGQKRLVLSHLKWAQWKLLQERFEAPPLFCLDDFGLHLDELHRGTLAQNLTQLGQVFLTAPVPLPLAPTHIIEKGTIRANSNNVSQGPTALSPA